MSETYDLPVDVTVRPLRVISPEEYRQRLVMFFADNEGLRPAELADALIEWQADEVDV